MLSLPHRLRPSYYRHPLAGSLASAKLQSAWARFSTVQTRQTTRQASAGFVPMDPSSAHCAELGKHLRFHHVQFYLNAPLQSLEDYKTMEQQLNAFARELDCKDPHAGKRWCMTTSVAHQSTPGLPPMTTTTTDHSLWMNAAWYPLPCRRWRFDADACTREPPRPMDERGRSRSGASLC
eukprot:SAG31_NODE_3800_length_3870_cov_2.092814_1_plen_179_part_00